MYASTDIFMVKVTLTDSYCYPFMNSGCLWGAASSACFVLTLLLFTSQYRIFVKKHTRFPQLARSNTTGKCIVKHSAFYLFICFCLFDSSLNQIIIKSHYLFTNVTVTMCVKELTYGFIFWHYLYHHL